jgi:hypothetical protein
VWVKRNWSDSWAWLPWLEAVESTHAAAPGVSTATLEYQMGKLDRPDGNGFLFWAPYDLAGSYCAIWIHDYWGDSLAWTGVIQSETTTPHGYADYPQGLQRWGAYGLEVLLDRWQIDQSVTDDGSVRRRMAFNERSGIGGRMAGNRSAGVGGDGVYLLSQDGEYWTDEQILEHLLAYHAGSSGPTFLLGGQLDGLSATVRERHVWGKTLRQVLDELVDRRRGMAWHIESNGSTVYVWVYSLLRDGLAVGGVTMPRNNTQVVVNTDGRTDLAIEAGWNRLAAYPEVIVQGGPVRTCCSLSYADGTLEAGWSAAQETNYKDGAGAGGTSTEHDEARRSDSNRMVYGRYRAPDAWAWTANNGEGTGTDYYVVPTIGPDGTLDWTAGTAAASRLYARLDRRLPLQEDSGSGLRPLMAVVKDPTEGTWHFCDAKGSYVRPEEEDVAAWIEHNTPHFYGKNHFDPADGDTRDSEVTPSFDWQDMIVTGMLATDTRLEVRGYVPGVVASEIAGPKVIEIDDAEAWYVLPGTVTGVSDAGALERDATGTLTRDDRDRLYGVLLLALIWYGQSRATARLSLSDVAMDLPVGYLLRGVIAGGRFVEVGTVVTARKHDYRSGSTHVWTAFSEMDARGPALRLPTRLAQPAPVAALTTDVYDDIDMLPLYEAPYDVPGVD